MTIPVLMDNDGSMLSGHGLFTTVSRKKGDFLLEYRGEMLSLKEARAFEMDNNITGEEFFVLLLPPRFLWMVSIKTVNCF